MEKNYPKYVTGHAVRSLCSKLNLKSQGEFTQDWEYEVADASRITEFLDAYEQYPWDVEEKFALMIIIIESCNDALVEGTCDPEIINVLKHHLILDADIHYNTLHYWALLDEPELDNCFAITPIIREII
ncbi:hypothetical protein [Paenibacillus xylanexedens]|uniref:hypothetical protein n=1 Tax=Paenibacillus xylanexedens TaxID=528191 RepID=UPI0011A504EC|nr:hypothetical protein [Paenibacillus xylanexedens]